LGIDPETGGPRVSLEGPNATPTRYVGSRKFWNSKVLEWIVPTVCKTIGIADPNWRTDWSVLASWFDTGAKWEEDIGPTLIRVVENARKRHGPYWTPNSLSYFTGAIFNAYEARKQGRLP